jgi:hypothetical protein
MKNTDISALASDVAEILPDNEISTKKTSNVGLIKLFIVAFILLLVYLLADKLLFKIGTVNSDGTINVVGIYYGPINTKSDKEVLVSLGKLNELQSGLIKTQQIKPVEIKPIPPKNTPVTVNKLSLLSKIMIGTDFKKVEAVLGEPFKSLEITDQKKNSDFKMYLWENKPQIICVFFKDKLISKLTK